MKIEDSKTSAAAIEKASQPVQKPQKTVDKPMKSGGNRKTAPRKKPLDHNRIFRKMRFFFLLSRFRDFDSAAVDISIFRDFEISIKKCGGEK